MRVLFGILIAFGCALVASDGDNAYEEIAGVLQLTPENFGKKILKENQISLVMFDKKLKANKEFLTAHDLLKGFAKVGVVNCGEHEDFCEEHGFEGKKTLLKLFNGAEDKGKYKGKAAGKEIANTVKKMLSGDDIPTLTKKTYKKWLKDNAEMPKAIFFKAQKATTALWKAMALQLKGRMVFAEIARSEKRVVRKFSVKDFPSVGVLPVSLVDPDDDEEEELSPTMYSGKVNAAGLHAWLDGYALESDDDEDEGEETAIAVEQITDETCLDVFCSQAGVNCAMLILSVNPEASKKERRRFRQELSVWKQLEGLQKGNSFNFVWMDGIAQMNFLDKAFAMYPQDYPQVVVLSGYKMRSTTFVGSYSSESVHEWLSKISAGEVRPLPLGFSKLPAIVGDSERCADMKVKKNVNIGEEKDFIVRDRGDGTQEVQMKQAQRGHRGKKGVMILNDKNFERKFSHSMSSWLIAYTSSDTDDCETCKALKTEWGKAGKELKNYVKFGWVDCNNEASEQICEDADVKEFPQIVVHKAGKKDEMTPLPYQKEHTQEDLAKYARTLLKAGMDKIAAGITKKNYEELLKVNPLAPKFILLTEEKKVPDSYRAIALEYQVETDADIMFGACIGRAAKKCAKAMGVGTDLPFLGLFQGRPAEGEVLDGKSNTNLQFGIKGAKFNQPYHALLEWCDQTMAQWQYEKWGYMQKGLFKESAKDEDEDDDTSGFKDEL